MLIEEGIFQDHVLNESSDFYALYLLLKRAKTPMAMRDAIRKYNDVLSDPIHRELLKTILAILETLYRHLNPDAGAYDVRFASLEEAVTMLRVYPQIRKVPNKADLVNFSRCKTSHCLTL